MFFVEWLAYLSYRQLLLTINVINTVTFEVKKEKPDQRDYFGQEKNGIHSCKSNFRSRYFSKNA